MGSTFEDELCKHSGRICKHMNDDHKMSLKAYCDYYAKLNGQVKDAALTGLDGVAMTVEVTFRDGYGTRTVQIPYTRKPSHVKDIRPIVVEMHYEAFKELGFGYRWKNGYYGHAASMASAGMKMKWKKTPATSKVAVVAAVAGAGALTVMAVQKLRSRR